MVVHNTRYANSKTVADYYAAARALDPAHVRGYDFGTADAITSPVNRDAFRNGVLTDIAAYIAANGIQGVAVSINCPSRYQNDETANPDYTGYASLCLTIGSAHWVTHLGGNTRPFNPLNVLLENAYWPEDNTASKAWSRSRLRAFPILIPGAYCTD